MNRYLTITEACLRMNKWSANGTPFLFYCNYDQTEFFVEKLSDIDSENMLYDINGRTNASNTKPVLPKPMVWNVTPLKQNDYKRSFDVVKHHIACGNSYLVNLTCATPIDTNMSLTDIFYHTTAGYKLCVNNEFVVFSPEPFVRISNGQISSFPMKGTIDANVENSEATLLNDYKEAAEHATIVDLIRNDLSKVATNVKVARYRYVEQIETFAGPILQTSSEVVGSLNSNLLIGDIVRQLLPAGSITGAPKCKTMQIIDEAETADRGFYTGVCGLYDGQAFDSGVMIRFVNKTNRGEFFHSGGGITALSDMNDEYNEMILKTHVPIC